MLQDIFDFKNRKDTGGEQQNKSVEGKYNEIFF